MIDILSLDSLKFLVPLVGAVLAWAINENKKRALEEYQRKEENYKALIKSLKGFYESVGKEEQKRLKNEFIDQLNLCWLYCPDEVIRNAYNFLNSVRTGRETSKSDVEKQIALGAFILSIRKDLLNRKICRSTELHPREFQLLSSS